MKEVRNKFQEKVKNKERNVGNFSAVLGDGGGKNNSCHHITNTYRDYQCNVNLITVMNDDILYVWIKIYSTLYSVFIHC